MRPYGQAVKTPQINCGYPGSIPGRVTKYAPLMILGGRLPGKVGNCRLLRPYGQAVKTPQINCGYPGSIPGRVTKYARQVDLADTPDVGSGGNPWGFKSLDAQHYQQ